MLYEDVIKVRVISKRNQEAWYVIGQEYWVKNSSSGFEPAYSLSAEFEKRFIYISDYIII